MKTSDAIAYAGSPRALADLLGITPSAITQWKDEVPPARQLQLERLTKGKLKADPGALQQLLDSMAKKASA